MIIDKKFVATFEKALKNQFKNLTDETPASKLHDFITECDDAIQIMRSQLKTSIQYGTKAIIESTLTRMIDLRIAAKRKLFAKDGCGPRDDIYFEEVESIFENQITCGLINNIKYLDPIKFVEAAKNRIMHYIRQARDVHKSLKVCATFSGQFALCDQRKDKQFSTEYEELWRSTDLSIWFDEMVKNKLLALLGDFMDQESGWTLRDVYNIKVQICKYNPLRAGHYIALPDWLKFKKAIVNIQNFDDECFAWAIISALFPTKQRGHANRVTAYPHYKKHLNFEGIKFPVAVKDVPKFESQNDISVNIFSSDESSVAPEYLTRSEKKIHVNLLLLTEDNNSHYCRIINLSRLLSSQCRATHRVAKFFCNQCLHYFDKLKLEMHKEQCGNTKESIVRLPQDKNVLRFTHFTKKIPVPFVVYAETMSLSGKGAQNTISKPTYEQRKIYNIGYYIYCQHDQSLSRYRSNKGPNSVTWFANELKNIAVEANKIINDAKKSKEDWCPFHTTLNVPVIFHNLSNLDANLILQDIIHSFEGEIRVVPNTGEKYNVIVKYLKDANTRISFYDSLRLLNASFENLSQHLRHKQKKILKNEFSDEKKKFDVLNCKGIFPHHYVENVNILDEKNLPSYEYFRYEYNKFYGYTISMSDYENALIIWNEFNCQTLSDYADVYLKAKILQHADVFQNFRKTLMKSHSLDPAHYVSLTEYTWDCALNHTQVELELLSDVDMLTFFERGMRGDLSQCIRRYSKANNKYMTEYNPSEPSKYIMSFNADNLYNWALSQPLPTGSFEWVDDVKIENVPDDSEFGYFLEVDLTYPSPIHEAQKDYPLCPDRTPPPGSKQSKMLATLLSKQHYAIHYKNLKQALAQGVVVNKIHRILKFRQSSWLKSYIDYNTSLLNETEVNFKRHFYKLMNNVLYDKIMDTSRIHTDVFEKSKWEGRYGVDALITKSNFHRLVVVGKDTVTVHMQKPIFLFEKPLYIGVCVQEITKLLSYSFHYDYILPTFADKAYLLYTDSCNLIYELQCEDIYDIMKRDDTRFDSRNIESETLPLEERNLGLMKDVYCGKIVTEFAGLRSKMYAVRVAGDNDKLKDVKERAFDTTIRFEDYFNTLENVCDKIHRQRCSIADCECERKSQIHPYDDKRFLIPNSTETIPWGHKFTTELCDEFDADMEVNM